MQFIFWSLDQSSLDVNQIWPDLKHYTVWNFLHQPVSGTQSSHAHRHMHTQRYKQVSCSGSIPLLISFLVSFYCYHGNNGFRLCVFAWTQLWCISACLLFFCVFLIITLSYAHTHTHTRTHSYWLSRSTLILFFLSTVYLLGNFAACSLPRCGVCLLMHLYLVVYSGWMKS